MKESIDQRNYVDPYALKISRLVETFEGNPPRKLVEGEFIYNWSEIRAWTIGEQNAR
jgi:hypothetical protein